MKRVRRVLAAAVCAVLLPAPLQGCGGAETVTVSREGLGTVVTITAYGDDPADVRSAVEAAFAALEDVESELDSYDGASDISAFNEDPYRAQSLPGTAIEILRRIETLRVPDAFSPALGTVTELYGFEDSRTVPDDKDLGLAVAASRTLTETPAGEWRFERLDDTDARLTPRGGLAPSLDLGGASKGLALDRAREALRSAGNVSAAIITAGSSTVTLGTKPDGTAWRIGIEDPRDAETVVAVFQFAGEGALSTSGDYQRYFESGGIRYHHILDPATGRPAAGVRSLTIAGTGLSGLDADILSTALFVRNTGTAVAYAAETGLGLYVVDDEGRALTVPAPEASGLIVTEVAEPVR